MSKSKRTGKVVVATLGGLAIGAAVGAVVLHRFGPQEYNFRNIGRLDATPAEAFRAFTDFERWPDYFRSDSIVPPEAPIVEGSQFTMTENDGQRVELTITDWYPPIRCAFRLDFPETGLGQDLHVNFAAVDTGTRLELMTDMHLAGPYKLTIPFMAPYLRHWFFPSAIRKIAADVEAAKAGT